MSSYLERLDITECVLAANIAGDGGDLFSREFRQSIGSVALPCTVNADMRLGKVEGFVQAEGYGPACVTPSPVCRGSVAVFEKCLQKVI